MHLFKNYKTLCKSLAFVSMLGLAQMAQALAPVSDGDKLAHDAKKLEFPRGDVAIKTGVCTDVIIRAYRLQNVDLQQLVNHDMKSNWSAYPKIWGLKSTDKNIDHRRVPNLEIFFAQHGQSLSITDKDSFQVGDIVTWRLPNGNLPHIGIVSDKAAADGTPLIIHNIGRGTQEENILYAYPIHKHFRY